VTESTQTLLRQLAELLDREKRAELPPERPELVQEWAGKQIHVLRPMVLPGKPEHGGGPYSRGASVTVSAEMVRASVDRKGHSIFDHLIESGAAGEGPFPADLNLWDGDDDPLREALHRQAVEQLRASNPNATPEMWAALHARYGTAKQRERYAREQRELEQRKKDFFGWAE
jgi:hypothetical protein